MCIPDIEMTKEKRIVLSNQLKQWLLPVRNLGLKVTCGKCQRKVNFWYMFRCLYCGIFYCKECAEEHFK